MKEICLEMKKVTSFVSENVPLFQKASLWALLRQQWRKTGPALKCKHKYVQINYPTTKVQKFHLGINLWKSTVRRNSFAAFREM